LGCGEAIMVAFDLRAFEYTKKALSMHTRLQTESPIARWWPYPETAIRNW
jgi:hypothetical protein